MLDKQQGIRGEIADTERDLESMNKLLLFFKGPALRRKISGLNDGDAALQEKVEELNELQEKIQGEVLPEPDGLSLESRRLINCAVIALAQHLVVHFADNDLIELTKTSTERPVGDMKFGDRRDCDRMVEHIRDRIEDLRQQTNLADQVRRRTDYLVNHVTFRDETDSMPTTASVAVTPLEVPQTGENDDRGSIEAPLRINVLLEEYWDLFSVLC